MCCTLPGDVLVPVANIAMGRVPDTLQSTVVVPPCLQPTLENHAVCSDDSDMGTGLGTTDDGVVPVRATARRRRRYVFSASAVSRNAEPSTCSRKVVT